jgi:succinoglycan biosynthesis transport protein ExoP
MTPDNPRIKAMDKQIAAVQTQIDQMVNNILKEGSYGERLSLARDQIRILTNIKNEIDARIRMLPEQQMTLASLTRATQAYESIYTLLLTRYQEAKITEAMKTAEIQVVDEALVPFFPTSPHHGQNLMLGVLLGLILGLIATFLLEYLDTSIKNPDDLESILEIPVLGTIGKFADSNGGEEAYSRSCLLSHNNPKSPFAEAYRIIRTNIMLADVDKPPKTILMTSAMVGEGKTTTCVNLATVMAQTGEKVILVDSDLRRSHLHHVFRIGREPGVTNFLARNATIEEVINPTIVDNLYFVPSGYLPPNPSELLASRRMEEMIEELKANSDVVIFDAPPVMVVTDAVILAKKLDGVIVVVHASITDRMLANRAVKNLKDVGTLVMGGILNGFTASRSYSRYGYYYYRYYREGYY